MSTPPPPDSAAKLQQAIESVVEALQERGKKIRVPELFQLWKLLSIGTIGALIAFFITLTGAAAGVVAYWRTPATASAPAPGAIQGWGTLQGATAADAFVKGGDASRLKGTWSANWWVDVPGKGEEPYSYTDQKGNRIQYPTETIFMTGEQAVVSAKVVYSSGENIWYWYEGRLSDADHATLQYWVERGDGRERLVGVVFLKLEEGLKGNRPSRLIGRWIGYVRDGRQVEGRTEWVKQD